MRETLHLRRRYRAILSYVGLIAGFLGPLFWLPLLAIRAGDHAARAVWAFGTPGAVLLLGGIVLWRRFASRAIVLSLPEGGVIVLLSWLVACIAGAVPFLVLADLNSTQAFFESVSGWTTTGLSVVDVGSVAPAILLWRSIMQLAGGAGLAIIMLAAITGPGGASLSAAEGRSDQLVPNVRASAHLVVRIYAGYAVAGLAALRAAGMGWFDAVNHAFCAISTGGFSTRPDSIGHWASPSVEAVTLVLMLLGSLNFLTAWCLLRGKWGSVTRNGELRLVALLVPLGTALLLLLTCLPLYSSFSQAVRVAVFETVTALTTTGYSTVGYSDWNAFGILILIVLMMVGGGACSTAGAIKQHRIHLLLRLLRREFARPFQPRAAVTDDSIWHGDERAPVSDAQVRLVAAFVFLYLVTWLGGSAVLAAHGYGLAESLFEFASTLGTVGLSLGVTAADAPPLVLWTQIAGMLLGRLEFFVVVVGAAKLLRDGRVMLRRAPGVSGLD